MIGLHCGGSDSVAKLQRAPISAEVYEETHRKKRVAEDATVTRGEFVAEEHGRVFERFTRDFEEKYQNPATRTADDPSLWEEVAPRKKGHISGFGTSHDPMFAMTDSQSTLRDGRSYHLTPTREVTELQEALQAEREELERRSTEALKAEREKREELERRFAEEIQSLRKRHATTKMLVNKLVAHLHPDSLPPL